MARVVSLSLCLMGLLLSLAAISAAPNDPFASSSGSWEQKFADQWALEHQRIYADVAPTRAGQQVIVAVIDTGVDYTHEDLAQEKIWRNPREKKNGRDDDNNGYVDDLIGWNFVDSTNNPWDESGHGTHIVGVIAACTNNGVGIAGINTDAVIMPLKVANFVGQARSANVAAAIYYAVDQGAAIINLSLGSELITDLEKRAAQYAQTHDVLVIVSAGNKGSPAGKHGYAALPGAMVVGAMAPNGTRAGFSNFGDDLALLAPGVDILSLRAKDSDFIALSDPLDYQEGAAIVGVDEQYYRATGTSFAAAVATGVASKLKSQRPQLRAEDLHRLMTQGATDVEPPGFDQLSGFGGLDYIAALAGDPNELLDVRLTTAALLLEDKALWVDISGRILTSQFTSAELAMRPLPGSIPKTETVGDVSGRRASRNKKSKKRKRKRGAEVVDPYAWQSISDFHSAQPQGRLARLSIDDLTRRAQGSTQWELRLTLNGQRHAYMTLALPQPEVFSEEAAESE